MAMSNYFRDVLHGTARASEQIAIGLESSPNHAVLLRAEARLLRLDRSRFVEALEGYQRSAALDPLSSSAARVSAYTSCTCGD